MKEKLTQWGIGSGVYLCMESSDVWQKALRWSPESSEGFSKYLDNRTREMFALLGTNAARPIKAEGKASGEEILVKNFKQ
jgi:hypothetical protein